MKNLAPLMFALVVSIFLASCGREEDRTERSAEESSAEGTSTEEATTEETSVRAEPAAEETTTLAEETSAPEPVTPDPTRGPTSGLSGPPGEETSQEYEQMNFSPEGDTGDRAQGERGISATQTASPDPATVGSPLTFVVVVTNNSLPQHVGFKDFLPPGVTFVSATPGQGFCGPPHHSGNLFDCTLGTIPTGGSVTVEIVAIPTAPGTVTNLAQAGTGFTPAQSVSATVTVQSQPE